LFQDGKTLPDTSQQARVQPAPQHLSCILAADWYGADDYLTSGLSPKTVTRKGPAKHRNVPNERPAGRLDRV
jgi:hypothetical protein